MKYLKALYFILLIVATVILACCESTVKSTGDQPNSNLEPMTTYYIPISTQAKDLAGNAIESTFVSDFTTGNATEDTQTIQGPSGTLSLQNAIITGDVDNDGLNELVVGWFTPGNPNTPHSVVIYEWTGSNYTQISSLSIPTSEAPDISIYIGDVNGDGQKELVVMNATPSDVNSNGKIRVYKYSNGTFQLLWSDNLTQGFRRIETGNLDTDTAEEIVIGNSYYDRTIYMYDYQGNNIWNKTTIEYVGEDCFTVRIADADNDGQNEIIAGFGIWSPYSIRIYKYSAGSYQKIWSYSFCSVSPYGPHYNLDVGDTDNDGKNEIFVTESQYSWGEANPNDVFIFEHAGGSNWTLSWAIDLPDAADFPYIGQIQNQQGNEFAFLSGGTIYIYKWNGSTYSSIGNITGWAGASWITGGDTDNDSYHETIIGKGNNIYIFNILWKQYFTLTIAAGAGGTTNPAPGSYTYDTGTQVTLTATPNSGYKFSRWSGAVTGTTNPITITMDADKSITANFTAEEKETGKKKGCFIATAAYGSALHPHVKILRDFRDKYLMTRKGGRKFVSLYYRYSPVAAEIISKYKILRLSVRIYLLPAIGFSYLMLHLGVVVSTLLLVLFSLFPVFFIQIRRRRIK